MPKWPRNKTRRRTNVQQLTCNIDSSFSFYYLFFSFVLLELKPWESPGGKIMKSVKNCECTFTWALENFPWALSWESSWGPSGTFYTEKNLNLRGHFRGHLRAHSRVHFREHFRERVRGSNFAVRVLCLFWPKEPLVLKALLSALGKWGRT